MNGQLTFAEPRARRTDVGTAHEAAAALAPGNDDLVAAVRRWVFAHGPSTQQEIAVGLVPDESVSRWLRSSVVSACSRARLTLVSEEKNRRGRNVGVYAVLVESVEGL